MPTTESAENNGGDVVDDAGNAAEHGSGAGDLDDHGPEAGRAGRDAARYRTQLRTAEAERDQLREQLQQYRTADVVQLAEKAGLRVGSDLLLAVEYDDLAGEDGLPDPAKIEAAAAKVLADHPHWGQAGSAFSRPKENLRGGGYPDGGDNEESWADFLGQ